ncbi:MAG: ABC transporter permease [Anaerolineae bacterium]|jgi:ABC-2 type transport system permease protein
MFVRIFNLIAKELIQFGRDRILAMFILLAPALQLVLMAASIERGIHEQPVVIMDLDRSRLSRQLTMQLDKTRELHVQFYVESRDQMQSLLDKGNARLAVIIPAGFARELHSVNSPQRIQIIADATNTVAASTTMSAATGVVGRFSADLAAGFGLVVPELIDFRTNVRFNSTMDVRDFSIPAQLGFITYQVTLAVASLGLARERELGTLEQLMVTPLRRLELALGKCIPAAAIGGLNFVVLWIISQTVFHVPMNGSFWLLAALTTLFISVVVGWGLLISAISRTQQQSILFVFILAMTEVAFSGFLVPPENMPALLQTISRLAPLQHYLIIIRGVMLKGAGLAELWTQVAALAALSLAIGLMSLRSVARRLG